VQYHSSAAAKQRLSNLTWTPICLEPNQHAQAPSEA
jgi:hypothetical protein